MRPPYYLTPATVIVASLLTACGGGGGGKGSSTAMTEPAKSLASLAAKDIPAQWPGNFKTAIVKRADLASDAELAQTSNRTSVIFIQIWYLDQNQQRQPVAVLTLEALIRMGGNLTIPNVPKEARLLKSEVYTSSNGIQQTLASKEIAT